MSKSACLILTSCLALQGTGFFTEIAPSKDGEDIPLYHSEHARELLGERGVTRMTRKNLKKYIEAKAAQSLPARYRSQSRRVAAALIETANKHHMDPLFLMAVITQESKFNPDVVGTHGEIGLMQIKPDTAQWLMERSRKPASTTAKMKAQLKDPVVNIRYGAEYLAYLRQSFRGHGELYISAYNLGAGKLRSQLRHGSHPHIYSSAVLSNYREFNRAVALNGV